jgi:CO/xanthine dehydrogenase Mo-binding subunit
LILRDQLLRAAASLMQTTAEQLLITDGVVRHDSRTGATMAIADVAAAMARNGERAFAEASFESSHMVYPYGVHVAQVQVDRLTGHVKVERYLVAYDIGRAVNPMLVEGQITGGVAQGVGGALLEEFLYDESGEPLSVTFADYLMPTAREIPPMDVVIAEDAPSPLNSLGLKGAGEAGVNAVGAAIAAAIDDAIGSPGAIRQLPVTPQRMKSILRTVVRDQTI